MIKEAAATYGVSRAKIHRLIKQGRIEATGDPRDERVKLLRKEELDSLFLTDTEGGRKVRYETVADREQPDGRITPEMAARMDAVRERVFRRHGTLFPDSAEIIREEREKRSQQVYEAALGVDPDAEGEAEAS